MLLSPIPVTLLPYFHNKGADQTVCISTKFSKELQLSISISSFCDFDELIEAKPHCWVWKIGLASYPGGSARIWTLLYVESVKILLIVEYHGFVAFVLISANVF